MATSTSDSSPPSDVRDWLATPASFNINHHGGRAHFTGDASAVERRKADDYAYDCVVYTSEPLPLGHVWQTTVLNTTSGWIGGLVVGVTSALPESVPITLHPYYSGYQTSSNDWLYSGRRLLHNKTATAFPHLPSLDDRPPVGFSVGLLIDNTGALHIFFNGTSSKRLATGLPINKRLWGVVDVRAKCSKIKSEMLSDPQVITDERAQQIIDQALKSGSVKQRDVVAVITGLMGSGKTCLLSRLFHRPPPDLYTSTGIAEQSYRGLLHHIGNMSTGAWNLLSHKDIREFLAPLFLAGMTEANVASLAANLIAMDASDTTSDNPLSLPPPPSLDTTSMTPSQPTLAPTPMLPSLPEVSPTCQAMVRLVKKTSGSTSELLLELVHMIDTGGQPEYMEVMPCLIHNANLALLVLNLMYGLDEHPPINFHVKGVAYKKRKLLSQYTSRQIILKLVSTLKCKKSAQKVFRMLVVATHRDCVKGDLAALIDALNRELRNLLLPACKEELILYEAPYKVAFVLNLKNPNGDDDNALDLIRQKVSESNLGGVVEVPGSFLMYEQDLLKFAGSVKRDILSLDECLHVGDKLKMNGEVVKAALVFFHRHNTFLYFRNVLPNHVFVQPQVPLDFVNAIVRFSYRVSGGNIQGFPAKFVSSLQDAIITEEMLSHSELSCCFIPGVYEPEHAIKLFCHTFTIAPLSRDQQQPKTSKTKSLQPASGVSSVCSEYLMMCLLPAIPDQEIPKHIPSSFNIVPLVVKFTDDCVPLSCFSSTISCLLSKYGWKVSREPNVSPLCLAHNIVSLYDPTLPVKVVLVDSAHHLQVHIDADTSIQGIAGDICAKVREAIFGAIGKVFEMMQLTEIDISPAVFCPCKNVAEGHCATFFDVNGKQFLRCSRSESAVGRANRKQLMWISGDAGPLASLSDTGISQVTAIESVPCMTDLLRLNVPQEVGVRYLRFGIFLLDDRTGNCVANIATTCHDRPEEIVTKILQEWIGGRGKQKTWKVLIETLQDCDLNVLAEQIQESASHATDPEPAHMQSRGSICMML